MKLLTHNILSSKGSKGAKTGYALQIIANDVRIVKSVFNEEFIKRLIPKLDWKVLVDAATQIGHRNGLPEELINDYDDDKDFLKKLHHVLMEIEVVSGELVCPETDRIFFISNGIPNMLMNDD